METKDIVSTLTPMILGGGTLLAMASLRNSDIATRSRACMDRLYEKTTLSDGRRKSLKLQIDEFEKRYVRLSWASCLFAASIAICIVIATLSNYYEFDSTLGVLYSCACFVFLMGLYLMIVEFVVGIKTLREHARDC